MGTSVNQPSPATQHWKVVQEMYDDPSVPPERLLREIWRAATNQPEGNLAAQLADPSILAIGNFATSATSPAEASYLAGTYIAENEVSSLATDIAKRAVMQSVGKPNPTVSFVERLFAEATNYLVSRDLPGHITPGSRLQNVSEARTFRRTMTESTASAVSPLVSAQVPSSTDWPLFVEGLVNSIQQRSGRRIR